MATRPSARGAIGELALLKGGAPAQAAQPAPVATPEPTAPPAEATRPPATTKPNRAAAKKKPEPAKASRAPSATVKATFDLPDTTNASTRSKLRPVHTGYGRSLSAGLLMQAYVRVLDELELDIDVDGLTPEATEEAVDRVRRALEDWKAQ